MHRFSHASYNGSDNLTCAVTVYYEINGGWSMSNKSLHDDRARNAARSVTNGGKTACIDAGQVFDSCSDRDCVENVKVRFTGCDQQTIDNAVAVRAKKAKVVSTCIDVEEVPFKDGCFSCHLTFFIKVNFEMRDQCGDTKTVCGCVVFEKTVVLFGGEGSVQVFSGEICSGHGVGAELQSTNMPRCSVQVAEPVVLDAVLSEECDRRCTPCCGCDTFPDSVAAHFGGQLCDNNGGKAVSVTIGLFTIVQLIRNTQLLVPVYDYCVPCKECSCDEETPCEMFRKMSFPIEEFFPSASCKTTK